MQLKMKSEAWNKKTGVLLSGIFTLFWILSCEPLVYEFDNLEGAESYSADHRTPAPENTEVIKALTWNIRFGAGRLSWFGDGCGDRVILTSTEVKENLQRIAQKITEWDVDLVLLQEVDVESKRSAYIDQVQWLLDHTEMNYGVYASAWHAQFIPSDGLGRMNMGTAILSRWPLDNAKRIALPLRDDQDALTQYFYLRRNMLKAKLRLPGQNNLYVLNIHTAAFSTDDTKFKHIQRFLEELNALNMQGATFIAGGDLNTLPPGSDSTDFCLEDSCPGESFHHESDDPFHKEGSDYSQEQDWLSDLYLNYTPAVAMTDYQADQPAYFTHTTQHPDGVWDRKLDYLFTNGNFVSDSDSTHQEVSACSDHAPLSVDWRIVQ